MKICIYTLCNYVEKMEVYERDFCVSGFHVYWDIWEAAVWEVLNCKREPEMLRAVSLTVYT